MKKVIVFVCCILMATIALTAIAESVEDSAVWQLSYYVDEFRLPTDEAYVTNAEMIEGIFSNSETTDSLLNVSVMIDEEGTFFNLYEYGDNKVKNSYSSTQEYNIIMLDDERERTNMKGFMLSGDDRICFDANTSQIILNAMQSNASLSFYIEGSDNSTTNYLFTIKDLSGLSDALTALQVVTWEKYYQSAVQLYNAGSYGSALQIFAALGNYKDSAEWKTRYQVMKYEEAETLLASGDYDSAIEAFTMAGDYSDAAERAQGVQYDEAIALLDEENYEEAYLLFTKIQDYKDASEQCLNIWIKNYSKVTRPLSISAGQDHIVALKSNGTAIAEGYNYDGQCNVNYWSDIIAISASIHHTVGLKSNGAVIAVGYNDYGQCDVNDWADIIAVSAGGYHTVGLKPDGTVIAVGYNDYGQCDVNDWTDIIAISAGVYNTVGLKSNGTVIAVGYNDYGACYVNNWSDIVAVSTSGYHTVGLKSNGTVIAAGDNSGGQRNVNDWSDIVAISTSMYNTVGLKSDGTVIVVGYNNEGQCDVNDWSDIIAVSAGVHHTIGLKSDGTVIAVGKNGTAKTRVNSWSDIGFPWISKAEDDFEALGSDQDAAMYDQEAEATSLNSEDELVYYREVDRENDSIDGDLFYAQRLELKFNESAALSVTLYKRNDTFEGGRITGYGNRFMRKSISWDEANKSFTVGNLYYVQLQGDQAIVSTLDGSNSFDVCGTYYLKE